VPREKQQKEGQGRLRVSEYQITAPILPSASLKKINNIKYLIKNAINVMEKTVIVKKWLTKF
jgi:hypothetical protein